MYRKTKSKDDETINMLKIRIQKEEKQLLEM